MYYAHHWNSPTSDLRSFSNAGVNSGTGPGGGVSVPGEWETTTESGVEPRWRVSNTFVLTFSASTSHDWNSIFLLFVFTPGFCHVMETHMWSF